MVATLYYSSHFGMCSVHHLTAARLSNTSTFQFANLLPHSRNKGRKAMIYDSGTEIRRIRSS